MKRIKYIDISRAFAIFLIVFGHTIVHSLNCHVVFKILYSFHVPLFFIISGYTFNSLNKDFKLFLRNKIVRILLPYFIWAFLFLIPYYIFGGNINSLLGNSGSFNLGNNLLNIIYGVGCSFALKQNTPLWFLPALFTMEVCFFYICKVKKDKARFIILLLLAFLGIISSSCITVVLPFGLNTFLNIGFFFYLGFILKNYDLLDRLYKFNIIAFTTFIGVISALVNGNVSCVDYQYGNMFLFFISGSFLSLLIICLSRAINENSIIEYIGQKTLGILIFHKLIVVLFQTKIPIIIVYLRSSNIFLEVFLGIIISIITILICLTVTRFFYEVGLGVLIGEKNSK